MPLRCAARGSPSVVATRRRVGSIYVLAGTNGAGKSSLLGEMLRLAGTEHFNPDAVARRLGLQNPAASSEALNATAWEEGRKLLERAIRDRLNFAFETTLGGGTIPRMLAEAARSGVEVRVWYIGLASAEHHLARVRARVKKGGHDIPEAKIRERFDRGRENLIALLPVLTELRLLDNTWEADPDAGQAPRPKLVLHLRRREIAQLMKLHKVPAWAKPIVMAALRLSQMGDA